MPMGSAGYVHSLALKHGKLCPRATKLVFTSYPAHWKWYVMYREHYNGGITEMNSHNIDILEDEFPSIWRNLKQTSNCISYNKTFNYLSMRRRILILTESPRIIHLPYLIGMVKTCLVRRMRFIFDLRMLRRINLNMQFIHMFRISHLQGIVGVIFHMLKVP